MVWESLRLRIANSSDEGGKPAARKTDLKRPWTDGKRDDEETRGCERRVETAKGTARSGGVEVKNWKF